MAQPSLSMLIVLGRVGVAFAIFVLLLQGWLGAVGESVMRPNWAVQIDLFHHLLDADLLEYLVAGYLEYKADEESHNCVSTYVCAFFEYK